MTQEPKSEKTPRVKSMRELLDFFEHNPGREYIFRDISREHLWAMAARGWLVGAATSPPGTAPEARLLTYHNPAGAKSIACVVRRPAPEKGRPLPGVFLLDGAPPPPRGAAREEEQSAAAVWAMFEAASARGMSMVDFVVGRGAPAFILWAQGRKV